MHIPTNHLSSPTHALCNSIPQAQIIFLPRKYKSYLQQKWQNDKDGCFYNCDENYALEHKCKEHKLFQIDVSTRTHFEDIIVEDTPKFEDDDKTTSMQELDLEVNQEEPLVSLHDLSSISSPQTLELQGYIKHRKVVVLVDS